MFGNYKLWPFVFRSDGEQSHDSPSRFCLKGSRLGESCDDSRSRRRAVIADTAWTANAASCQALLAAEGVGHAPRAPQANY